MPTLLVGEPSRDQLLLGQQLVDHVPHLLVAERLEYRRELRAARVEPVGVGLAEGRSADGSLLNREGQPRLMFAAWAVSEYIGPGDVHQQPRANAQDRKSPRPNLVVCGLDAPPPVAP